MGGSRDTICLKVFVPKVVSQAKKSSGRAAAPTPLPEGSADEGMHIFGPEGEWHACKPALSVSVDVLMYMARPFRC